MDNHVINRIIYAPEFWVPHLSITVKRCSKAVLAILVAAPLTSASAQDIFRNGFERRGFNDTGANRCATNSLDNQNCPQSSFPDQDGDHGRDSLARAGQLAKLGGGEAGFDFTKISNSGNPLPASAALGSGTNDWACTRDNVTGLIWEVKVNNASHLRHMDHRYFWYSTDAGSNGGVPGSGPGSGRCNNTLARCQTQDYVEAVNTQGLCGYNDWRMPTLDEISGIMNYGRSLKIDPAYFLNTSLDCPNILDPCSGLFWARETRADFPSEAWGARFNIGNIQTISKNAAERVRLVRAGQ